MPRAFHATPGTFVKIRAGSFVAYALWDPDSPLALRIYSRAGAPDAAWVKTRVDEAFELRQRLLPPGTDAFRVLFGEGDGLPGISVDVYAGHAVLVSYSKALSRVAEWVKQALAARAELFSVSERALRARDPRRAGSQEGRARLEPYSGSAPPRPLLVRERGLVFEVDLEQGQKTGLFLDQRDNREFLRPLCASQRVLNLFAYTGGFSVAAAAGGASHVTSVDIAAPAIAAARRNFAHNGFAEGQHDALAQDALDFLVRAGQQGERWSIVIADPPSYASSRSELHGALRAYRKLHVACLRVLEPGGLYAAGSCSSQVSADAFRQTLADASARALRRLTIVREAAHAFDHPYTPGHLEGRYLKFVVSRVLPLS